MSNRVIASSRGIASPRTLALSRGWASARDIVVDPTLVFDEFLDVALTAIGSHTPDTDVLGGGWLANPGTWRIDADGAGMEHASNDCEDVVSIDAGEVNVDITLVTNPTSDEGDYGVCFRYSALNAMYFYDFAPTMRIVKFNPGASVIGTNTGTPGAGRNVWRARLNGNSISCWIEGVANTLITLIDSDLNTNTRHGIRHCLISANARYGQIRIEPAGRGSEPPA